MRRTDGAASDEVSEACPTARERLKREARRVTFSVQVDDERSNDEARRDLCGDPVLCGGARSSPSRSC